MTLLSSIWRRQLVSFSPRNVIPVSFAIESFQCVRDDEHLVLGRDSSIEVPPFACRFNKTALGGYLLAIADEDGCVKLLDTRRSGQSSILKEWSAHTNAVFDVAWMEGEEKLVTASGDQTAVLWDACVGKSLATFKGHSCSLKSVNFRERDPFVFATGARDGNVMVWDVRCNRRVGNTYQPVNTIHSAHKHIGATPQRPKRRGRRSSSCTQLATIPRQSVTAVVFQDDHMVISAGAVDGNVKMWDLRRSYSTIKQNPLAYHTFPYPGTGTRRHGFSSLTLDPSRSQLFASCTNDKVYMFSCTTLRQQPISTYTGHLNSTFYVKAAVSPDGAYLLSGSSNSDAYLWSVHDPWAEPFVLKGHVGEVTSVAWCSADQGQLVTCSDDNNFRIWRINRHSDVTHKSERIGYCERLAVAEPNSPKTAAGSCSQESLEPPAAASPMSGRSWIPSARIFTDQKLNRLPCLVGLPLNSPEPAKTCSPKLAASPSNHSQKQPGTPKIFFQDGFPSPPPCPRSPDVPDVPSPARPSSPQALLKSWLKLDSKQGGGPKATAGHVTSPGTTGQLEVSTLTKLNVQRRQPSAHGKPSNLLLQQDLKENERLDSCGRMSSVGPDASDESSTKSPAAKRRCILGPSNWSGDELGDVDSGDVRNNPRKSSSKESNDITCGQERFGKRLFVPSSDSLGQATYKENRPTTRSKHFNGSVSATQECSQGSENLTASKCLCGEQDSGTSLVLQSVPSPRATILTYFKPSTLK